MMYLIAIINFVYAPLMFLLKNPPVLTGEQQASFLELRINDKMQDITNW